MWNIWVKSNPISDHNSTNDRTNVWLTFSLSCCFEAHNLKKEYRNYLDIKI